MTVSNDEILRQSRAAFGQWGEQWKTHAVENGKLFKKNGTSQKDLLHHGMGKLCIIAAVGSSLQDQIEILKANRDKYELVCVDKAFKILMDQGIRPDFVVLADANVSFDWGREYVDATKDITLIANICGHLEWTHSWKGRIIFYVNKDNIETEKIFMQLSGCTELIPAASNVGNTAVVFFTQICQYDQYLLVGFDYGWRHGQNYYAFNDHVKRHWMRHMYCLGQDGQLYYTSVNLDFSVRWLRDYVTHQIPKTRLFDCSIGGLLGIRSSDLGKRLEAFTPRGMTASELNQFFGSRVCQENVQYQGPDHLVSILRKYRYIAGVTINYLPTDIQPRPDEVTAA